MARGTTILALIAVGFVTASSNAAFGEARTAYGVGTSTCAYWKQVRSNDERGPSSLELQSWVDGFLSGYNIGSQGIDFIQPSNEPESVAYYEWIDNYCAKNPLDRLIKATMGLKDELTARAKPH